MKILKTLGIAGILALAASAANADKVKDALDNYNVKKSTQSYSVQKSTQPAEKISEKPALKLGAEIGVLNESYSKNPIADWSRYIDERFVNGDYTSTSRIQDWQGINAPSAISMNGAEASLNCGIADKFSIGLNAGYKESRNNSTSYAGTHIVDNITTDFSRRENYDLAAPFIGASGKLNLSKKLAVMFASNLEFVSAKGTMQTTVHRQDNNYTKWYDATFEGSSNITSLEAGIEFKPIKNLCIQLSGGAKLGNINAKGKAIVSANVSSYTLEKEYNPNLNLNSSFVKTALKYNF